jgi:pimeloyl-ACP methyl ester carboxylesterase
MDSALGGHETVLEWQAFVRSVKSIAGKRGVAAAKERWLAHPLFAPACERPLVAAQLRRMVADYSGWHWLHPNPIRSLDPPANHRLATILAPTLVLVGDRDGPDALAIAAQLADQLPNHRRLVLSGVGHLSDLEAPECVNAEVLGFLSRLDDTRRG